MKKSHENYKELIWMLAKTDFKLRYQGSVLGYFWAILKPLLLFTIMNFVFSSIFNARGAGIPHYSLQLLVGIMMFNFFSEGTMAGMTSLVLKSQLVTKIYIPRWTIILSSTLNVALIYIMNITVIIIFFIAQSFVPSPGAILLFFLFSIFIYILIISFSLFMAPLYVRLRDLVSIWEVVSSALLYASPIIYPLQILPIRIQKIILINPMAFIIHFTKEAIANNHFADLPETLIFFLAIVCIFFLSILSYQKFEKGVAEEI
jgi:ABC-type polysaccharide/polyol phosphate export permease